MLDSGFSDKLLAMFVTVRHLLGWMVSPFRAREDRHAQHPRPDHRGGLSPGERAFGHDLPPLEAVENEDWGRDYVLQRLQQHSDEDLARLGLVRAGNE